MIELPDYIYERSVLKQLYLKEESRHLFQKNAYSVSISGGKEDAQFFAEASTVLTFKENPILKEEDLNDILRKLMCAGGSLEELRVQILFKGEFKESELRQLSSSLKAVSDSLGAQIIRVSVSLCDTGETEQTVFILGSGAIKSSSEAPWKRGKLYAGQDIILTGSIGKYGMTKLFSENLEELRAIYPEPYIEKLKNKRADRLPIIETDTAAFYKTTAMVPLGPGGLLAGLWSLGDREKTGLMVYADRLSYEQETIELCNHFNLNPLMLDSKGAYLLATDMGEELVYALRNAGLRAVCIGRATEDKKRVIVFDDEERFIESPKYSN